MITRGPICHTVTTDMYRSEGGLQLCMNIDAVKGLGVSKLLLVLKLRRRINGAVSTQAHSRVND